MLFWDPSPRKQQLHVRISNIASFSGPRKRQSKLQSWASPTRSSWLYGASSLLTNILIALLKLTRITDHSTRLARHSLQYLSFGAQMPTSRSYSSLPTAYGSSRKWMTHSIRPTRLMVISLCRRIHTRAKPRFTFKMSLHRSWAAQPNGSRATRNAQSRKDAHPLREPRIFLHM